MKKTLLSFILAFIMFLLASCGKAGDKQKENLHSAQKQLKVAELAAFKVGVMPTLDCLPIYLLKDSVLYDSTKIDIRLRSFTSQMDCDTALIGGSVQAAISDLVRVERLKRKHLPLTFFSKTNTYWLLLANRKSRLKDLSQLGDKMVAMKRGKPKYDGYKVQINDVFIRTDMMINNEIDAMWLTEPQATAMKLEGHNVLMDSQKEKLTLGCIVLRTQDIVDTKRQQQLEAFTKAYNVACEAINKNGVAYYSDLLKKYMHCSDMTIQQLPKIKFQQANRPEQSEIDKAQAWLH